jgi:hypothetical protein
VGFGEQPAHLGLVTTEERDGSDILHGSVDAGKSFGVVERTTYDVQFRHVFDAG